MSVTLSVNEILADILAAFKLTTPELFSTAGFCKDFKSDTAVLGTKLTAKIAHVPLTADYDPAPGVGFYSGAQSVTSLIEDVPVTLDRLKHVPVKIPYLTGLAAKGVDLYKAAVATIGWALGKHVIDSVLSAAATSCSHSITLLPSLANLDGFDGPLRAQCNAQKMLGQARWALIGTNYASQLGADDRTRNSLFYGQLNGENGYRLWKGLGGFAWLREYPEVVNAGTQLGGIMGDPRFALVSVRKLQDMENAARELGIKEMMRFYPLRDPDTGLELCGISFQQGGTGDVYLTVAILFGVGVGNQGGAAGTMTDDAGCLIRTM